MVTLRSRQMKPLFVAFVVAGVMLGLAVSGALGAEPAGDEQRPINIDVRDMAIGDVLRMLGQAAGVNIIVGQNVTGEIQSLTLRNVSVEAALRRITEAYGYHWRLEDNIYVVSSQPAPEPRVVAAPAVAEPEGPEGQPRGDAGGVPPPPRPQMMEPDTVRPPVTERPQILYEMIPLSYASARDVAAWFGGTVTASPAGLYPQSTRGMASAPGGSGALSSLGAMSASTGMGAPWGLQQFAEPSVGGAGFGGVQPGAIGGGFGAGVRGGVTGATGAVGGTIILPGEMQAPVAIMSHNALLVRGTREELDEFREMLELLDMPAKQVEIATKWIDVSTTVTRALGIDWAVTNGALEIFNLGFAPGEAANNGIRYGRSRWWAELSVLQNTSMATVINEPRVTCMNGMPGTIAFETEIPYFAATISYNQFGQRTVDYTSDFIEVSNELYVVPQINPDDSVQMLLAPTLEDQVGTVEGPNGERIPIVTSQYVETMVRVMDGETVVLGGVIRKDESVNLRKTPLLADIPIIGKLFQSRRTESNDSELLIFVTPKIVRDRATE